LAHNEVLSGDGVRWKVEVQAMKKTLGVFVAGVTAAFLFDPASGEKRREAVNKLVRPVAQRLRQTKDKVAESGVADMVSKPFFKSPPDDKTDFRNEVAPNPNFADPIPEGKTNDPTLVSRVESELFEDGTLPKGTFNIDAVNGVVTLRGTVNDAVASNIVLRTRAIDGVTEVVDLLERA
jgi:BON domain